MEEIQFDDIEALKGRISEEFGPWGPEVEVTQEMINQFADVTGDHQWIHVDVERAKRDSPFGGPIAHGFLTLSLLPGFLRPAATFAIVGFGNATNYGADKLRFISPVPAGRRCMRTLDFWPSKQSPRGPRSRRKSPCTSWDRNDRLFCTR